jgi:hypothetical protein
MEIYLKPPLPSPFFSCKQLSEAGSAAKERGGDWYPVSSAKAPFAVQIP